VFTYSSAEHFLLLFVDNGNLINVFSFLFFFSEIMSLDKATAPPRLIPSTRFTLALLVSFALFVQYAHRVSLSMGIVCMVNRTNTNKMPNLTSSFTQVDNRTLITSPKYGSKFLKEKQFFLTELQQQILLGAYWFGYLVTLAPGI
jgi:hypothetical protein